MRRLAIPPWRTPFWTAWCITPTAFELPGESIRKKKGRGRRTIGREVRHDVEMTAGDLVDAGSLWRACEGAECILATATAPQPCKRGDSFRSVEGNLYQSLIAARQRGVQHFV